MAEENKEDKVLEEHKKEVRRKRLKNYHLWQYATAILAILLVMSFLTNSSTDVQNVMSSGEVEAKVLNYVNTNLLAGQMQASSFGVEEENGMYKIGLTIGANLIFISLDGLSTSLARSSFDLINSSKRSSTVTKSSDLTIG